MLGLCFWSRSVGGGSAKLPLHSGRVYWTDKPWQRHDHEGHLSGNTAIEGSAQRISRAARPKWRKRTFVHNAPMGPKTALDDMTAEHDATVVAFRRHTLLPL